MTVEPTIVRRKEGRTVITTARNIMHTDAETITESDS